MKAIGKMIYMKEKELKIIKMVINIMVIGKMELKMEEGL